MTFLLKANGSIEKFKGFKKVYNYQDKDKGDSKLPELNKKERLSV